MGKALYRKYRPISLANVVGQDSVIKPLSEAIKSGNFSHAYIFTGPRGCGKTSVARIFAHEINGFKYELEDSYIDIIEIDGASNTSIDDIREIREKAMIAPAEGKYKVYIIDEFHMLSRNAFNGLLKLLEEPPEHVIFILATTNLEKVPITITSRAQIYNFKLASPEIMLSHLKNISEQESIKIDDDALKIIVRQGGGSFRDSISLLDQISNLKQKGETITTSDVDSALGLPANEKIRNLLSAFESGDSKTVTDILKDLLNSGPTAETLASDIIARIIENPTPKSLRLIDKLFNVQYPFAEAKLLVAFLEANATPASQPVITLASSPKQPTDTESEQRRAAFMQRVERSKIALKNRQEEIKLSHEKVEFSETSLTDSIVQGNELNLKAFVKDIKELNRGLGSTLESSRFVLKDKEVQIYPKESLIGVLRSRKNLEILKKAAPGFYINIIDTTEEKIPDNSISVIDDTKKAAVSAKMQEKIDALSGIMGKGTKVIDEEEDATF